MDFMNKLLLEQFLACLQKWKHQLPFTQEINQCKSIPSIAETVAIIDAFCGNAIKIAERDLKC